MVKRNGIDQEASVIITGASTGIGKAMALILARKYKARLCLNARSQDLLEVAADEARKLGSQVITVCGDVSKPEVITDIFEQTDKNFGHVDILVNNAGFARPGRMTKLSVQDWRDVFEVNFFAPLQLTYAALPSFLERKQGKIVNIASVAGKIAFPGSVCYASTKFALTGFSEGMASELAKDGVDVITVCPGLVRTEFFRKNKNSNDFTELAKQNNVKGWLLRHLISISSEEAAEDIIRACERGGSHEIILTMPGKFLERVAAISPQAAFSLARLVPPDR